MSFFKRLFGGKKSPAEAMRGLAPANSDEDQSNTRSKMEAEMTSSRDRRAGAAAIPGDMPAAASGTVDKEETVVALVTRAFAGMDLQPARIDVQKAEGGTTPTLRFTLESQASTDLERARISEGDESPEDLANTVISELRRQARL